MNITRILPLRAFLVITLLILFACLTMEQRSSPCVHIVRNVAWNDFISQINFLPDDSPQDSFDKELLVVRSFSRRTKPKSELESTTSKYSGPLTKHERVCRRPTGIWKHYEKSCPTRKAQASLGGDLWNSGQPSFAGKCKQPIVLDKANGYVCFKIPGTAGYHFFPGRFRCRTGGLLGRFLRESR